MLQSHPVRKVLIIPSWYPSEDAPKNGIFVQEQARALARRFEVSVLTPRFPILGDLLRLRWGPRLIRARIDGVDTWQIRKLKIPTMRRYLPGGFFPDHAMVYGRKFAAAIRDGFRQYVQQCGLPDIIHAHVVLPAGMVAMKLAKEAGVPIVLTEHSGPFSMHLTSARQISLVQKILTSVDRVAAVSPSLRQTMHAFCPEISIDVIGNLIDTDFYRPADVHVRLPGPFRFFYLGTLTQNKGIQYLLHAVRNLQSNGRRDFELVLGGDGPYRSALIQLANELGIDQQCRFLGMLDRSAVLDQMQKCDLFVLPSLGETFGIVLGEAMSCGKAVLSTRCGGPEDVVTPQSGLLVPCADSDALADAMASFMDRVYTFDPHRIRASVVERFGVEAFLAKTEQLYADAGLEHAKFAGPAVRRSA